MKAIVLHGLWMRGVSLTRMVARLRIGGHEVETFDYLSLMHTPEQTSRRLYKRVIQAHHSSKEPVALIGHSLGGVMAAKLVQECPDLPVSRVLALGSPLKGAYVANALAQWPISPFLLGKSRELLCRGLNDWSSSTPFGVVAGRMPIGLGLVLGLTDQHDGTVQVSETKLTGIHDHVVVAASHTGLLFSDEVAQLTLTFLDKGRFSS